jgi:hypothetical protein
VRFQKGLIVIDHRNYLIQDSFGQLAKRFSEEFESVSFAAPPLVPEELVLEKKPYRAKIGVLKSSYETIDSFDIEDFKEKARAFLLEIYKECKIRHKDISRIGVRFWASVPLPANVASLSKLNDSLLSEKFRMVMEEVGCFPQDVVVGFEYAKEFNHQGKIFPEMEGKKFLQSIGLDFDTYTTDGRIIEKLSHFCDTAQKELDETLGTAIDRIFGKGG